MGKVLKNKRQINVALMVGAILILIAGVPLAIAGANSINGWLSDTYAYTQMENTTKFYEGPIVDDVDTEGRYASVNGTTTQTVTAETPVWDTTVEWDQITITSTGDDCSVIWNLNVSATDLLKSDDYQLRMKFNGTKGLDIVVNAVKFDGVTLTSWELWTGHVSNESQVAYWNWTPTEILDGVNNLNADATDEVYIQIIVEGEDDTKLTTGDVIQFQFALGGPDNTYAWSSWQILTGLSMFLIVIFMLMAIGSTSAWDPLTKGVAHGYAKKGYRYAKKKAKSRRSRS